MTTTDESKVTLEAKKGHLLVWICAKVIFSASLLYAAYSQIALPHNEAALLLDEPVSQVFPRRRLADFEDNHIPTYMEPLMKDLEHRRNLFRESPREEVKYWFEYSGPLQKYYYRFSRQRGRADYFEGRDDSGVVSARFLSNFGGTQEYRDLLLPKHDEIPNDVEEASLRLYRNCLALGSAVRSSMGAGTTWNSWFGKASKRPGEDRCRVLLVFNTVGAGRGRTILWETSPPIQNEEPPQWISEQATALTHIERNFREINAMCQTGLIAARVQMLVCENISPKWIDWMDSLLVDCGGRPWSQSQNDKLEERPSPVQIVVVSSAQTAEVCHDLKSGFMEQRAQDLIFAHSGNTDSPNEKKTNPALVSSDEHDLYVSMKWNTLVTTRAISSFLQASSDMTAAAASPGVMKEATNKDDLPESNFLVPSFVQVSYVSEENSKIAKWRMHGDFFHPAAWEICKDSFDVAWIPHSLSDVGGTQSLCQPNDSSCGQWWIYFTELQMPISPAVYANEVVPAPIQGGSNAIWMVTERHRRQYVRVQACRASKKSNCPHEPQAVIPLGDLESFLINFTPNTALGRRHVEGRRPGYTKTAEFSQAREEVRRRKQLEDEDIETALFDYTIYPAALFRKDATLKAARKRDAAMTGKLDPTNPQMIKSLYYDITITKPRPPVMGWCQAMARLGLCSLFADFFRSSSKHIKSCAEACGMALDFSPIDAFEHVEIATVVSKKKE